MLGQGTKSRMHLLGENANSLYSKLVKASVPTTSVAETAAVESVRLKSEPRGVSVAASQIETPSK